MAELYWCARRSRCTDTSKRRTARADRRSRSRRNRTSARWRELLPAHRRRAGGGQAGRVFRRRGRGVRYRRIYRGNPVVSVQSHDSTEQSVYELIRLHVAAECLGAPARCFRQRLRDYLRSFGRNDEQCAGRSFRLTAALFPIL